MSDLFNQIKNAILTSKALFEKSKNVDSFCKKYQSKDFDDFSFKISDSFKIDLITNSNFSNYDLAFEKSEEELEDCVYLNVIRNKLEDITFDDSMLKFYLHLNIRKKFKVHVNFESLIGYSNEKDLFQLRKNANDKATFRDIFIRTEELSNLINIVDSGDTTIGYADSEFDAIKIISNLTSIQNKCQDLQTRIKVDLNDLFFEIKWFYGEYGQSSESKISDIESKLKLILKEEFVLPEISKSEKTIRGWNDKSWSVIPDAEKIINKWVDLNCDSNIRSMIKYNPYNSNFSINDEWLIIDDLLSKDNHFTYNRTPSVAL
jgi:hypothetical protein